MEKKAKQQNDRHPFEKIAEFDEVMRKLVQVPKADVELAERAAKTPRPQK